MDQVIDCRKLVELTLFGITKLYDTFGKRYVL